MTLKATGGSCWWLFTSRAWVRAKMVWASCGLDGGPIKVTRFALYSWGPIWSKHTNGVVLFYFNITANKLLYYQDHEPIYMAEGKDCLKLWIGWRAHQEVWFVYDMEGVAKAFHWYDSIWNFGAPKWLTPRYCWQCITVMDWYSDIGPWLENSETNADWCFCFVLQYIIFRCYKVWELEICKL